MTVSYQMNAAQEEAIEELRCRMLKLMSPQMHQDINMFYRFLKARDFNIDDAEIMLKNHLKWRKEFKVDTIIKDFKPPEVLVKYFPGCMIGQDKEGCPVKYYPFGNLNGKGVRKSAKFIDIVRHVIFMVEKEVAILEEETEKQGKRMTGTVAILDMKNLSFSEATDRKSGEHAVYLLKQYQDNYPERLKAVYIVNVSPYFFVAFKILKAFLASTILSKIHICTADQQNQELLKIIDHDVLPAFLGGTKTDSDGDPMCKSFVHFCGKVPEEYFKFKGTNRRFLKDEEGVQKLTVSRMSHSEIEVSVAKPGLVIQWEFETKGDRDVGFGIALRHGPNDDTVVLPQLKLEMEDCIECGAYECEEAGNYILLFDNSYSWFRSKELYYKVNVAPKDDYEKSSELFLIPPFP